MLIVMAPDSGPAEVDKVLDKINRLGLTPHPIPGSSRMAIGITGNDGMVAEDEFLAMVGVQQCIAVSKPYKLVSREVKREDSTIQITAGDKPGCTIGGGGVLIMAGPCSVESREQITSTAAHVKAHGAGMLRGGAFKPRTSPYAFQGLKDDGLALLREARAQTGLPIITEAKDTATIEAVAETADVIQIGARNMQNFSLLEAAGEIGKPVMLKRGIAATVKEWLMAAEYIAARGNLQVMLCERGIRTFETTTRNTLDLGILPSLREMTHLPIVVDPSHGTGRARSVAPLARAALALGVDAIMVETHPDPASALSDGPQALTFPMFEAMMKDLRTLGAAIGHPVHA